MADKMTGGQALARSLIKMGAARVYGIIGTSNIGFVDALYEVRDRLRYVSCRHEQVAASMADAEGRLTGVPGVALVHSGPGALNAMISAGNAYKDSSPLMIITGAVKRRLTRSDGMLELDHLHIFAPLCKGTYRAESASDITEIFSQAYQAAMSGSRGPVLIEVPEDVWLEAGKVDLDGMRLEVDPPPAVRREDVRDAINLIRNARLPLILSGGGVSYSRSSDILIRFAEALEVPVITTGNGRGTIPESHRLCLGRAGFGGGTPVADRALERADALLCLGAGVSDMTTYEFTAPVGPENIIVVNISPDCVAPQWPHARLVVSDVAGFIAHALDALANTTTRENPDWVETLSEDRAAWNEMREASLNRSGDRPSCGRVVSGIAKRLPDDTIVSVGAGMHLLFPMAFMPCNHPLTFLSTVNFGSMGFGFAACMAAQLIYPERQAVSIIGDGDFMMTVQDLETAVRERIPVKVFVLNDRQYRVLNVRQKLQFQGRVYGTDHGNPDLAMLAKSFGAAGYTLERPDQVDEVLDAAVKDEKPVVVDVMIDPEDLPPMNIEANLRMSAAG